MAVRIFTIIILFSVTGCIDAFKPQVGSFFQQDLLQEAPPGPTKFKLGWRDGCDTGISASGNQMHKFYYKFTQKYELVDDNVYYTGWKVGYNFCNRYVFRYMNRRML